MPIILFSNKHVFKRLIYLLGGEKERSSHLLIHSSKSHNSWELIQDEARSPEPIQVSHVCCRSPSTWTVLPFPPRHISRELHWKQPELQPMSIWDTSIADSSLLHSTTTPPLQRLSMPKETHTSIPFPQTFWSPFACLCGFATGLFLGSP